MQKQYRIIFESFDSKNPSESTQTVLNTGEIKIPIDLFDIGFSHVEQITIIQKTQDALLKEQFTLRDNALKHCPDCDNVKLVREGQNKSNYYDIFTDHKITLTRRHCPTCSYEIDATIKTIFGSELSAELAKAQAQLGADYSYRDSEHLFELFSQNQREINNHDRIKKTSEIIGAEIKTLHQNENKIISIKPAAELIINVDGGHINTIEPGKRSFEAMAAVVYKPEALQVNVSGTKNILTSKHCAASACSDNQNEMIANTIVAALKEGLTPNTHITALCDGAKNCWQIITAFIPIAATVTCILDWFHLSMKIHNIALPADLKSQLESVKWHLWHGQANDALTKLNALIWEAPEKKQILLKKLKIYIENNSDKIINYDERQNAGLVYTSNLAESTVESLINQRCKGQQHMRWSRDGLDPILQLRAAISSNEWNTNWKSIVTNAISTH